MSLGISFGSIGDLIAVGQLAFTLAKALSESRGSSHHYRAVVKELRNFDQALLQVVALWQNYESSPKLELLRASTRAAVQDCRETLLRFKDNIEQKYGSSLGSYGAKHWVKDASKKLIWLREREDVESLRKQLETSSESIIMLTLVAVGTSSRLDSSKQEQRIQAVHCLLQDSIELQKETNTQLGAITRRLDAQAESTLLLLKNVKSGLATFTQVRTIIFGMYSMLSSLHILVSEQMRIPKGLDACWKQAPVTLEDALGDLVPLPPELVTSWEMFHTVLGGHFANRRGHHKVLSREYTIQDDASGEILSDDEPWKLSVHAGQKLNMSMAFNWKEPTLGPCSDCSRSSETFTSVDNKCANPKCKLWYQRLAAFEEDTPPFQAIASHSDHNQKLDDAPNHFNAALTASCRQTPTSRGIEHETETSRKIELRQDKKRTHCLRIVERYSMCHCLYYEHAVDQCAGGCGVNGKCRPREKTVFVGYACQQHSRQPG